MVNFSIMTDENSIIMNAKRLCGCSDEQIATENFVKKNVDEKVIALFNDLNKTECISFEPCSEGQVGVNQTHGHRHYVYVWLDDPNLSASVTHELLHVFLAQKNASILSDLHLRYNSLFPFLIPKSFCYHISNCLEHIKMLPIFLQMGFPRESFLSDSTQQCITADDIYTFKTSLHGENRREYNAPELVNYVSKFIAAKCSPFSNTYEDELNQMRVICPRLSRILDHVVDDWLETDIMKESVSRKKKRIEKRFYRSLKRFFRHKTFVREYIVLQQVVIEQNQ